MNPGVGVGMPDLFKPHYITKDRERPALISPDTYKKPCRGRPSTTSRKIWLVVQCTEQAYANFSGRDLFTGLEARTSAQAFRENEAGQSAR